METDRFRRGNLNRVGSDRWTELNDEEARNRRFRWAGDGKLVPVIGQDPMVQLSGQDFNFGSREDRKIKKSF